MTRLTRIEQHLCRFSSQDQRGMHPYAELSDVVREVPQMADVTSKKPHPASAFLENLATLACGE